jgi:4-amino-4-deoxy-L-arabinose transferase-like glycosyltransferase
MDVTASINPANFIDKAFNRFFIVAVFFVAVFQLLSLFTVDIMNIDSSQYALISKEMYLSGSYLEVYCRAADYLDKPPLLFWSAALAFKNFGVNDWAFRLPSILVYVLGLYSLYRYAKLFYHELVAKLAVLVMLSCVASYMMVSDVRTDTLLAGWILFALWQLAEFNKTKKNVNIILGAIGIGMAMLSKGPIGLVVPVIAFSCDFFYKKQWSHFFRWQYIVALIVVAVVLLPMSYGLYLQYDLHPEKNVYNLQGPSGLEFFYWTQSFGRITGENYWDNNPDPFFLYHSFLWSFLPWVVFFIPAYYHELKHIIKSRKLSHKPEVITFCGFTFILIFLSLSKYQLPHYTFLIHPLAALMVAKYLHRCCFSDVKPKYVSTVFRINCFVMLLLFLGMALIINFVFPANWLYNLPVLICLGLFLFYMLNKNIERLYKLVGVSVVTIVAVYYVLSSCFYPNLLRFQSDSVIAYDLNKPENADAKIYVVNNFCGFALDFYCQLPVKHVSEEELKQNLIAGKTFIVTDSATAQNWKAHYSEIKIIKQYNDFSITQLTPSFLNPSSRPQKLRKVFLLKY